MVDDQFLLSQAQVIIELKGMLGKAEWTRSRCEWPDMINKWDKRIDALKQAIWIMEDRL